MHEKNNSFSTKLDETHLNEIKNVYKLKIEMFVTLQDGFSLTIQLSPEHLKIYNI